MLESGWEDPIFRANERFINRRVREAFIRRRRKFTLGFCSVLLVSLALIIYAFAPSVPADIKLTRADLRLAAWLGVAWSMERQDPAQVNQLADQLKGLGVDDVYVFVSYLTADDAFNPTFDFAPEFVAALKRSAPGLRVFAWIGAPVSFGGSDSANRLESAVIRRRIADFSRFAVEDLGFDGLHLNAELVADGDAGFLQTLRAIGEALPAGAPFSATAHPLRLDEALTLMPYPVPRHHWSAEYFQRVARKVDQLVLMAYDSGLVFPRDYINWVRYQTWRSQDALQDLSTELVIGVSLSAEWTLSHQTQAETLPFALAGITAGLGERLDGIAIYPFWELDESAAKLIANGLGP